MRISDWSSDVCSSDLDADRAVDRPGQHLRPTRVIGLDEILLGGVLPDEQRAGLDKRPASILGQVPVMAADIGEEALHRRLIAVEKLAVEIARVPESGRASGRGRGGEDVSI